MKQEEKVTKEIEGAKEKLVTQFSRILFVRSQMKT